MNVQHEVSLLFHVHKSGPHLLLSALPSRGLHRVYCMCVSVCECAYLCTL